MYSHNEYIQLNSIFYEAMNCEQNEASSLKTFFFFISLFLHLV